jgi:hypothetical protein
VQRSCFLSGRPFLYRGGKGNDNHSHDIAKGDVLCGGHVSFPADPFSIGAGKEINATAPIVSRHNDEKQCHSVTVSQCHRDLEMRDKSPSVP